MRVSNSWAAGVAVTVAIAVLPGPPAAGQAQDPTPITGQQGVVGGLLPARARAAAPAPRNAAGRVLLAGATPADTGVWVPAGGVLPEPLGPVAAMPLQPWARALYTYRLGHQLEPHARCKASGVARQFLTPYGVEVAEFPEMQRVYIFDIGGPQSYRTVHLDGRGHPPGLAPSYYGHSIGWWEGDTLVIETVGFNEGFWMDREGLPHTERLRTMERLTRIDRDSMRYELTIDDPGAYTAPWTGGMNLRWEANTELFEYVCQQANYAHELMVGTYESVDRTSPTVP